ncbi:MAG TPA: alpha-E domain-containing protein [Steroidobacteraceae bacterium]|nr:alpha-E domain-containing protein [Steroidobacteraceae bacterium]
MLSRLAENVYWMARYLERTENMARLVRVNAHLLLDLPPGYAPGWLPMVDITGGRELFDAASRRGDEREVVQFLIADRGNPGSLISSLTSARENARTLRDLVPREAWEHLNTLCMDVADALPQGLNKRARYEFLNRVIGGVQTMTGMLEGIMNRNDASDFMVIGRNLERADMTSRIVDVRSAQLLPSDTPELRPFENIQWMSVLKSLSGYQMYRLKLQTRVNRVDVLEFLLRDDEFPRSYLFCLREVEHCLKGLPSHDSALRAIARLRRFLKRVALDQLDQEGLHRMIDHLQLHLSRIHDRIAKTYFPQPGPVKIPA